MESIKDRILKFLRLEGLLDNLTGYVEARIALVKMEIREEVAGILSRGLIVMLILMVGFLFILFLSFATAQYLNVAMESEYWGYVTVCLFFGLILLLLIVFRKGIFKAFEKRFVELIRHRQQ